MTKKRFEVVQNIPAPYRNHLFTEMSRQLQERDIDFCVHFMAEKEPGRPDSWTRPKVDFPCKYWSDYGYGTHFFNPGLVAYLARNKPDYLLVGSPFDTFTSLAVSAFCRSGTMCTWVEGQTRTPGAMGGLKGWIKRWSLARYRYVAVPGADGIAYIQAHQKRTRRKLAEPILLPNLVDETRFKPRSQIDERTISQIRESVGVGEGLRFCIIPARLIPEKGLCQFISLLTPEMLAGWKLVIIGEGPLAADVANCIKGRGLERQISIHGFVDYAKMPYYYAAADLFLLPSVRDQNPLSVVEGLHSGLPIALSDQAGNADEAVSEGRNGWRLPVFDAGAFKDSLTKVFATPIEDLRRMGGASLNGNAKFWDTKQCIKRFLDVVVK